MTLDAFFIGIIQVLVYAGAVMVLFLFIIMLLDLRTEELRRLNWVAISGGMLVALLFLIQVGYVIAHFKMAGQPFPVLPKSVPDDVRSIGFLLFSQYTL